jgi:hypothetical protein
MIILLQLTLSIIVFGTIGMFMLTQMEQTPEVNLINLITVGIIITLMSMLQGVSYTVIKNAFEQ